MAISCCKEGLTSRKAAELFLHRCGPFMGLPREIQDDNQSIISSTFFNALCNLAGNEQAKSLIYELSPMAGLRGLCRVPSILCGSTSSAGR